MPGDEDKTKEQLINELAELRQRVTELEAADSERKRAETEVFRQLEILNALYAGAQKLSRSLDPQELAQDVARTCVEVYDARMAWLGHVEPDGRVRLQTHFPSDLDYPRRITVRWDESPAGQGPAGQAVRTGYPAVVHDVASDPNFGPWREEWLAEGFCTVAAFPLMSRGRTIGVMVLYSDQPGFFTGERVDFFQSYTHLVAAALENARLLEEANRRLEYMKALREINMAIIASLDLRGTFNVILDQATSQLGVDAADILLLNPHTQDLEYTAGHGFRTAAIQHTQLRLGEGQAGRAALERQPIHIPNLAESENGFARAPLLESENFVSYHAVPLVAKGEVRGVLEILHRAPLEPDPEWLSFLDMLAAQTAIAIERQRLLAEVERARQRERQEQEIRSLEQLSAPPSTATTAQAFGLAPLRESVPEAFSELAQRYGELMDLALEQRAYRVEHDVSGELRSMSARLGFLKAGPRDVVEIHSTALKRMVNTATRQEKAQAYIEEGRLMVVEFMGYLALFYRNR